MNNKIYQILFKLITFVLLLGLMACAEESDNENTSNGLQDNKVDDSSNQPGKPSNMANFTFDCDLNGLNGVLSINVEAVSATGIVFGAGPNPDITGVISTNDVIFYTTGSLVSPTAEYSFTGENNFADFFEAETFERFRVQWVTTDEGVTMVVNPFGPGPASHECLLTDAKFL